MRKIFVLFLLALLVVPAASAETVTDPENVTHMKVEVVQSGHITLESQSTLATAEDLTLKLYVPQNDGRQKATITKVIGPDSYVISQDNYGNEQVVLSWSNPTIDSEIDYLVETQVDVEAKSSGESKNFPVTELVEPSSGIIETAYNIGSGTRTAERAYEMSNWVHDNVRYDLSCEKEAYSAKWVYDEGRGTCDEFSNLLVSILKFLDYQAWYVAGYAYLGGKQEGGETFGSHAWVEARIDGETYSMDPTWAEAPVDATHVSFARMPDSNFTEHIEVRSRDISIKWNKDDTRLELLEYEEAPRINVDLSSVPESVEGGTYTLIMADLTAAGCVETSMRIVSCIDEHGDDMIDLPVKRESVSFCDNAEFFWFGKTTSVEQGMRYTCPVSVAGGGAIYKTAVSITPQVGDSIDLAASTQKIVVPGQSMEVQATVRNRVFSTEDLEIFAILDGEVKKIQTSVTGHSSGVVEFPFTAPQAAGQYDLYVFSSSGDLVKETIEVISDRQLRIKHISMPKDMISGTSSFINITVTNLGEKSVASVRIQVDDMQSSKDVEIDENGDAELSFGYTADSEGMKSVIVSVLDSKGSYQDSWTGTMEVVGEASFKEGVAGQLEAFITWFIEAVRSLFGM